MMIKIDIQTKYIVFNLPFTNESNIPQNLDAHFIISEC